LHLGDSIRHYREAPRPRESSAELLGTIEEEGSGREQFDVELAEGPWVLAYAEPLEEKSEALGAKHALIQLSPLEAAPQPCVDFRVDESRTLVQGKTTMFEGFSQGPFFGFLEIEEGFVSV